MTQEDKQLLLKDLCARLPYRVKIERTYIDYPTTLHEEYIVSWKIGEIEIKPYLRPMSSMTEEEENEYVQKYETILTITEKKHTCILSIEPIEWLLAHHFDFRGLIERGLAIKAPEDMYKIN